MTRLINWTCFVVIGCISTSFAYANDKDEHYYLAPVAQVAKEKCFELTEDKKMKLKLEPENSDVPDEFVYVDKGTCKKIGGKEFAKKHPKPQK